MESLEAQPRKICQVTDILNPMKSSLRQFRELSFTSPYDWGTVLEYFRRHQVPHVEAVDRTGYERVVSMRTGLGWFRVEHNSGENKLTLGVWGGTGEDLDEIAVNVRRMFDLDADPTLLLQAMNADNFLSQCWQKNPGLRIARPWSTLESLFGAVLGQVVSVRFGRILLSELIRCAGPATCHPKNSEPIWLFPTTREIAKADLSAIRTSEARKATIRALAQAIEDHSLDLQAPQDVKALRKSLRNVGGIGAWTTEYVALRGFADNDAFPATDYALKQELKRHPNMDIDVVRPCRGYAAVALWKSFAEAKRASDAAVV